MGFEVKLSCADNPMKKKKNKRSEFGKIFYIADSYNAILHILNCQKNARTTLIIFYPWYNAIEFRKYTSKIYLIHQVCIHHTV